MAAVSTLYVLAAWSLVYALLGVVRAGNPILIYLAELLGAAVLVITSIVALVLAVRAAIRGNYSHAAALFVASTLTFVSPLLVRVTLKGVVRRAELRDLQRVGVATLRTEAAALAAANKAKQYPHRWFGGEVPPADIPPAISTLSARAAYVTAADNGVVLVTDVR